MLSLLLQLALLTFPKFDFFLVPASSMMTVALVAIQAILSSLLGFLSFSNENVVRYHPAFNIAALSYVPFTTYRE